MLNRFKKNFLDTLFPIACLSCAKDGVWLCERCLKKISLRSFQVCPLCEQIISACGKICPDCRKRKPPLDYLLVAANYQEKYITKIVHLYKYNFLESLAAPLGKIMLLSFMQNDFPLPDLIIPVPLHPRRLRWRGFNQSELLANYIGENLTPGLVIPILKNILIRKKDTAPQMQVKNYKDRRENIRNAFAVQNPSGILNKNILLIDDIATTGSTLFECARVLKESGAKKIYGAVISRQESRKQAST